MVLWQRVFAQEHMGNNWDHKIEPKKLHIVASLNFSLQSLFFESCVYLVYGILQGGFSMFANGVLLKYSYALHYTHGLRESCVPFEIGFAANSGDIFWSTMTVMFLFT